MSFDMGPNADRRPERFIDLESEGALLGADADPVPICLKPILIEVAKPVGSALQYSDGCLETTPATPFRASVA